MKKKAFTLVELIVVITILAILGTIAFISLQGYSRDARDSKRTSDLGNIKTSLELYSLKTGNFPKPDSFSTITYSGGTENVWFQGNVGDQVTTNLKSLNEKPLDPLTNDPYIYSVTQSYGEYEVLALYEGSVAYNQSPLPNPPPKGEGIALMFPQANAATTTLTPKVVGNYNGVFVKTPNYIIPTPSIVTSEPLTGGILILNPNNISSQVITNGINIPKNSLTQSSTGQLNINLSVYTGSINKSSGTGAMINAITQIQGAYTGTTISSNQNILYILNQTTNDQMIALGNITILKGGEPLVGNNNVSILPPTPNPYINCTGVNTPIIGDINIIASTTYDSCDIKDIIICSGSGSGYTIAACNVGTNTSGLGYSSYGKYFQWGNNGGKLYGSVTLSNNTVDTSSYGPGNYYINNTFITNNNDWSSPKNDNLWGDVINTSIARQGVCISGYHIPSLIEWDNLRIAGGWVNSNNMSNDLKIPKAGYRYGGDGNNSLSNISGFYWSSGVGGGSTGLLQGILGLYGNNGISTNNFFVRSNGLNIRCFKN